MTSPVAYWHAAARPIVGAFVFTHALPVHLDRFSPPRCQQERATLLGLIIPINDE